MKTRRKSLFKRGLSFFIAVTMCLSMLQMPVFAAEAHEHNQDGWECVWIEGSEKLDCKHEHDEECYRPGKDVLNCEDDHHTEECYGPGEDILICEDDSEEHEHNADCYAPGEDVLKCKENHHTEDCYVSGEDELNCSHEHDEDCYIVTEGRWECTAPEIEEAEEADEAEADDLVVEGEKNITKEIILEAETPAAEVSTDKTDELQEQEDDFNYATKDELVAAFEAVGEALEDGDVQAGIDALDDYFDVYNRLSPEDQEANADEMEAALAYQETLRGSLEGIEDSDVETLAYDWRTVTLRPITGLGITTKVSVGDMVWSYNGHKSYTVSKIETKYREKTQIVLKVYTNNNSNFYFPKASDLWNIPLGKQVDYVLWSGNNSGEMTENGSGMCSNGAGGAKVGEGVYYFKDVSCIHSYSQTIAPNCINTGLKTCSKCGATQTVAALGHSFPSTWTDNCTSHTDLTCTGHKHICTRCNGSLSGGTETAAHSYGGWVTVTEPKPGVPGLQKRTCTASGCEHYETKTIAELPVVTEPGTTTGNFTVKKSFTGLAEGVTPPDVTLTYEAWRTKDGNEVGAKESGTIILSPSGNNTSEEIIYSGTIAPTVWNILTSGDGALSESERSRYKNVIVITESNAEVDGYTLEFAPKYPADGTADGNHITFTLDGATFQKDLSLKNTYTAPTVEGKQVGILFYKVFKGDLKEIPLNAEGRPAVNYVYQISYNPNAGGPSFESFTGSMECVKVDKTPSGNTGNAVYKYTATVTLPQGVENAQLNVTETNKEIAGYRWSYEDKWQGSGTIMYSVHTPTNPMTFGDFIDIYDKIPDSQEPSINDLEITKTVDKSTVTVGEEVTYTIEVKNTASQAVEVDVVDELPEEMFTEAPTVCDGGTYDKETHTVTWNKVSIPAGETKTLTVTVKAVKSGTFTNTAKVVLNGKDKSDSVEVEVKEKDPSQPLVPKLEVTKKNDGFKTDPQTGNAFVKYTITVTNISGFSIYGLRITDTLDQPTVTKVNPEDVGEAKIKWIFKDFKVKTSDNGKWGNATPSGKEDDLVHVLQPLARYEEFADGQTVTLTYTIEIENLNDDVAVKVKLDNTAVGASWSKAPTPEQVSRLRMSRSALAAFAAVDDEPDVTDSASSSASSGEISGNGGSSTEGELPRKYSVIYTWDLPEGAKNELPTEPKHPSGAVVSVDIKYTSTTEIEVNGKTYIFSGWSTDDAAVENHQFTMPAKNVTIYGTWKEKNEGNPNVPDKPGTNPETHKVTVHYVYTDGSKAADDEVRDNLTEGTAYSIPSPGINGYTPDQIAVNGTMGKEDIVLTVTYTRDSTGNPGGGSSGGGGGGSTATNQTGRVHGTTPSPESEVTVPGDGVPLAEIPEGTNIADEDVPLAGIPVADIPDADVPLAGIPDLMYIPNDDVPLARVPKTGDSSGLWHMMALLSAFGLMAVTMIDRKKHQEKQ